uniref:Fumarate hydratase n=1 Tax=Macrostomum lignano TaxID=282301 RepID=A0A1I8H7Y7_9PLAT
MEMTRPADSDTPYKKLTTDYVCTSEHLGKKILHVDGKALTLLAQTAMVDIAQPVAAGPSSIPRRSKNDKFVALELLKNANIAANMVLPGCQDTGTAIVIGKKGQYVMTHCADDASALSHGVYNTYTGTNLRYSQAVLNPRSRVQILVHGQGGGSANKTFLYQQTKSVLNPEKLLKFVDEKIKTLGTAACPPYHLAIVIGGTSAEACLKTVKLASARYLDNLHDSGNEHGRAFRDHQFEEQVLALTRQCGIGAQFGGKYFCHDVRVVRLPGTAPPAPLALGKIDETGVYLEQLETDPSKYLPEIRDSDLGDEVVKISTSQWIRCCRCCPMVARDIAHAKLKQRLDSGQGLPQYIKDHPVYYAGPAKTPEGYASGSFGPTTAGRMDSYVDQFQAAGGSMVMLAKGNRSRARPAKNTAASTWAASAGPAAILAQNSIKKVEVLEYQELGMEAVWRVEVENFPAFIVVDNKGNDFFK